MSDTAHSLNEEPVRGPSGTLDVATRAAKAGAADAKEKATQVWNSAGLFVSRFVYTTTYTLSYGIVFPTVFIAKSIPKNNVIVKGFIDGANAATEKVEEIQTRPAPHSSIILPAHA